MTTIACDGKSMAGDLREQLRDSVAMVAGGVVSIRDTPLNTSGFTPYDTRLVILPDVAPTKQGSILLPDQLVEKNKWAQTKATLIAAGENAFADWGDVAKPRPGDRIVVGRYAGNTHEGADGREYTVCNDEDVLAGWSGK